MSDPGALYRITTPEQLASLFEAPGEASLRKEVSFLHPQYRRMIEASPFAILATCGPGGLDTSPRGDAPGFVVVEDEKTLLLPERRGNNRVDGLKNLLSDPRVALLFLIPGVGETLRVNGRATISVDPALLARFAVDGKLPKCVLVIAVETVFYHCARAMQRSQPWQPETWKAKRSVPTPGKILAALTEGEIGGEAYDRELPARQRATLY